MKKYISISLAVMAISLAGCAGGPFSEEDVNVITIKAVMAENNTRTVIQDGTTSVLWEQADEIKVFYDGIGSRFANQNTSPSGTAKFSGSLNVVFGSNEGFSDSTPLWGLYPYRADATADNTSVTTTLPADQTGRAGSFAKGMNITLGKSSSLVMGFYNVCGGIRFSLTQEGVKEVIFEGQNNENIAGKVKIAFADGVPAVQQVVEGQKTITLSAPYGQTFETGKWYYIVALPGTLANGFKMTFNTATQYATLKSSDSKTIKRGIFGSLADADENLVFRNKEGDEPQTGNIVFADPAAKYACVAKYDNDGDGEVSIEEAEAATSFNGLFTDWKGVVSFDEIRYFKNVHSLSGVFGGCNKLISITIPENITDLGNRAFYGCTSLTSVILPSNIAQLGNYTFYNCSQLTTVDIPINVSVIGGNAFEGCSKLNNIDLPGNLIWIGEFAFRGCSSLSQISIPDGVTTIDYAAFQNCRSLTSAKLPSDITWISSYCFSGCSSLTSVDIPSGITSIGEYAFDGVKICCFRLPSSVTSIGDYALRGMTFVALPSPSIVSIRSNTLSDVKAVFVPSNLIEQYKVRTDWANYDGRLLPLSAYREEYVLATSGAVDMGLSVKWAAYNVGATAPEESGGYYSWGETEEKASYYWKNYFDSINGSTSSFNKYYNDGDGKIKLDLDDDVAHVKWGGSWRMPTTEEIDELIETCISEWTRFNGVNGQLFYSIETGNKLFLPCVGRRDAYSSPSSQFGYYWSSTLDTSNSSNAYYLGFSVNKDIYSGKMTRHFGTPIRPVCE